MNILLFGSTGMLGNYMFSVLKTKHNVICITREVFDIETDSWNKLNEVIEKNIKYIDDVIINCAGVIPQKTKNIEYRKYIRVNSIFPHKLNEISQKHRINFIHITTDCVFDGERGNYTEDDEHTAKDIYGISKSIGEPEEATVIRTSIIGEEITGKKSLLEWVRSNANGKIKGFANHYWNGVTCLTLSKYIETLIDEKQYWNGIRHVFSPNTVTKYDLCCYINEIYDLNIMIEPITHENSKNLTISTISNQKRFKIDNIKNQIEEQKTFIEIWNI
jgi:dTDP-4-dehydrorhamnose reductase